MNAIDRKSLQTSLNTDLTNMANQPSSFQNSNVVSSTTNIKNQSIPYPQMGTINKTNNDEKLKKINVNIQKIIEEIRQNCPQLIKLDLKRNHISNLNNQLNELNNNIQKYIELYKNK
ncbi:MAG TPA: hypothetical protein DD649_00435 [Providencia sp.]|uniref:hypothetical protein n=1 Tax=Providencia sp. TaxID=589 RepID=UPI000E86045A|nr:hypothetical protein [Providencia sp.]MBP6079977.1 hypothetical protein [Providencia sp.]HBO21342.1 hypothetical protein [Providencia sp.]